MNSFVFTEATTAMYHRPSIESGTVVMDTPLETSVTSKKMSAAVLFTLEGMDLTLYQENEVHNKKHVVYVFLVLGQDKS